MAGRAPPRGDARVCQPWTRGEKGAPGPDSLQRRAIRWPLLTFLGKATCGRVQEIKQSEGTRKNISLPPQRLTPPAPGPPLVPSQGSRCVLSAPAISVGSLTLDGFG